jgi:hypothetical protein
VRSPRAQRAMCRVDWICDRYMPATIIVNIVVHPDEEVRVSLLLERANQLKGLAIHEGLSVHDAIAVLGFEGDPPTKLVRYSVDCEGPAERIRCRSGPP